MPPGCQDPANAALSPPGASSTRRAWHPHVCISTACTALTDPICKQTPLRSDTPNLNVVCLLGVTSQVTPDGKGLNQFKGRESHAAELNLIRSSKALITLTSLTWGPTHGPAALLKSSPEGSDPPHQAVL